MESEQALQRYLQRVARDYGIFCRKVRAEGRRGFPDIFLAKGGWCVFVELKSPTGKGRLSLHQFREIQRLEDAGMPVRVIDTKEGVDDVIQDILNEKTTSRY